MANTYTQLLIHIIFSTHQRLQLIHEPARPRVEFFLSSVINNKRCKALALYVNPDHCHILIGLHPDMAVSKLVKELKVSSTLFINKELGLYEKFGWQEGYGAFSHSRSQLDQVVRYILNQPEHHKRFDFKEEYEKMLVDFGVDFSPNYIFD